MTSRSGEKAAAATGALRSPPGLAALPPFESGWHRDAGIAPFLSYLAETSELNWSGELEEIHEETSRSHFLDRWTRRLVVEAVGRQRDGALLADVGCSTGYLLEELRAAFPESILFGVDASPGGLRVAHETVPDALLLHADACSLPFEDEALDAAVSANLLEHVPDDVGALRELARTVRPAGVVVIVVPFGSGTYDYYDRFLRHERRYGRGELAEKARRCGFAVVETRAIASLIYPVFWLVKKRNRIVASGLEGRALRERVSRDIAGTKDSRVGEMLMRLEHAIPFRLSRGIRQLVVLRRAP